MRITNYLVVGAVWSALMLIAPPGAFATVPSDFTLGPGGKVTISSDSDFSAAGCSGSVVNECDSYSIKIPLAINPSGDLSDDLQNSANQIAVFALGTSGQLCGNVADVFFISFPLPSLILTKTKNSVSAKFRGTVQGFGDKGGVMVPVSFTIKANRSTRIGTLTVKGLGQDLAQLNGAPVDVKLVFGEAADDGDSDVGCVSLPATFKNTP